MNPIALDELAERLGELALFDVRRPDEFAAGHIPGAVNLPVEELLELDPDGIRARLGVAGGELVVYCHIGQRSAFAAQVLGSLGYDARNYEGSWREWSQSGEPVES
ncbi:MAG: rhodanese-like domain-containing protein [Actinobacteria bacterium]|nr:rhodanese-like domain-containing protein [Actinomycetota bacterium]MBV8396697.1 rhodanese-like domain-containing protein [Actinomycetota bacterium]MBV8599325.1 rhodanese-like domain-containing protein [Actinomycetota bacterium]